MLYCLGHPSRFLSIFPSNWAYINNNKNVIYAPLDDDRPCFFISQLFIIMHKLFKFLENARISSLLIFIMSVPSVRPYVLTSICLFLRVRFFSSSIYLYYVLSEVCRFLERLVSRRVGQLSQFVKEKSPLRLTVCQSFCLSILFNVYFYYFFLNNKNFNFRMFVYLSYFCPSN